MNSQQEQAVFNILIERFGQTDALDALERIRTILLPTKENRKNYKKKVDILYDNLYWHIEAHHWLWGWQRVDECGGNMDYMKVIQSADSYGYNTAGMKDKAQIVSAYYKGKGK